MARTIIDRQKDNLANRINKRMQNVKQTLGSDSALYGRMTAATRRLGKKFLTSDMQINRGLVLNQIDINELEAVFNMFEDAQSGLNIKAEKRKLLNIVQALHPGKNSKNTHIGDYREAEAHLRDLSSTFDDAFDYFYNMVADDEPEKIEFLTIVRKRNNTYTDMSRVVRLARKHYERVNGFDKYHGNYSFNNFTSFAYQDSKGNEI